MSDLSRVEVSPHGFAASFDGKELHIVAGDDSDPRVVGLPDDIGAVHCLAFLDDVLYIGGHSTWEDTSRLGWVDVTAPAPTWNALEPPSVVGDPNQPIHAIMISGDRLVALDGAFTPKLALIYDISTPRQPTYLDYTAIPSGIDDHPVAASIGRSYAAILTTTRHAEGKAWKIGIFDGETMDEIATFYQHAEPSEDLEMPQSVLVHDDLLMVSHGLRGLGVVRLDDRQSTAYERAPSVRPWVQSYVPVDRIHYQKPLGQGRIIATKPTSDPHTFYLALQRGGRSWWEEIELR